MGIKLSKNILALCLLTLSILSPVATAVASQGSGARAARQEARRLTEQAEDDGTVQVIIEAASMGDRGKLIAELQSKYDVEIKTVFHTFPGLAIEADAEAMRFLSESALVANVQENSLSAPELDVSIPLINADDTTDLGWDGSGITVAILDTGIDLDHPFFAGRIVSEACYSNAGGDGDGVTLCGGGGTSSTAAGSADAETANCMNGLSNICSHGTHVAGIAAGNGVGVTGDPGNGVAPGANIIAIQVFTRFNSMADCSPNAAPCVRSYESDQIAALERVHALRNTFTIASANMSLGGDEHSSNCDGDARKPIIDNLRSANIATVIAAGNDGFNAAISEPACISTAITVGGTNDSDGLYNNTNRGVLLELMAPGVGIMSAVPDDNYGSKTGTSMATPHVAGAWAVLREAYPSMSVADTLALLQDSGVDISYSSGGGTVTTPRIDVLAALQLGTTAPEITANNAAVAVNEAAVATNSGTFSDADGDPLELTASVGTVADSGGGNWSWSFSTSDGPTDSQTVTITVTDDKGVEDSVTFSLTVMNVVPTVTMQADSPTYLIEGQTFMGSGSFTDPGADTWSATVDFGDGGGAQPLALVGNTFSFSHIYSSAGLFTVTVCVTDDDGGVGCDSENVEVITLQGAVEDLIEDVEDLRDSGALSAGRANSLIAKLNAAINQLDNENDATAINQLQAFINEVQAYINTGKLTAAQGQPLIDAAQVIIDLITAQL